MLLPPARTDGLGHAAGRPGRESFLIAVAVAALVTLVPLAAGADPRAALLGFAATAGVAVGVTELARRQIGGQTGDVAGAVQQLGELAVLLASAAR
jgi:adenosylcobinamide-GDP ribazoletransferase